MRRSQTKWFIITLASALVMIATASQAFAMSSGSVRQQNGQLGAAPRSAPVASDFFFHPAGYYWE